VRINKTSAPATRPKMSRARCTGSRGLPTSGRCRGPPWRSGRRDGGPFTTWPLSLSPPETIASRPEDRPGRRPARPGALTTAAGHRFQAEQTPAARRVDVPARSGRL
jgi:hypothetical protein